MHRGRAQGACDGPSEGRAGAAQVGAQESAGRSAQQVRFRTAGRGRETFGKFESQPCALLGGRLPQLTAAVDLVNEISKQLTERKSQAISEIGSTFEELEKALHQRKAALITEVENVCTSKQKVSMGESGDCGWVLARGQRPLAASYSASLVYSEQMKEPFNSSSSTTYSSVFLRNHFQQINRQRWTIKAIHYAGKGVATVLLFCR